MPHNARSLEALVTHREANARAVGRAGESRAGVSAFRAGGTSPQSFISGPLWVIVSPTIEPPTPAYPGKPWRSFGGSICIEGGCMLKRSFDREKRDSSERVFIRIKQTDKDLITRRLEEEGLSLSEYLRSLVRQDTGAYV